MPLDVTHRALMTPDHVERLDGFGTPVARAAAGMIRFYERYDIDKYDIPGAPLHDPCVIAYLVDPSMFSGVTGVVAVDHVHESSIGNTFLVDEVGPTARYMNDIDSERFFDLVVDRVGSL